MRKDMYTDFLVEIKSLASKVDALSENGSLALQEWKKVKKQKLSIEEYKLAEKNFLRNSSPIEKIYDNLIFEVIRKMRQAEEFLYEKELDNLKKAIGNDLWQEMLAWDRYQSYDDIS